MNEYIVRTNVVEELLKKKFLIILGTVFFATLSVVASLQIKNTYKSEATLISVISDKNMKLGGQLGGLAALAGYGMSETTDKTTEMIAIMRSKDFMMQFIEEQKLKPMLMAFESWDRKNNIVKFDERKYIESTSVWVRPESGNKKSEPSLQETLEVFQQLIQISQDKQSRIIKIEFTHYNPHFTKDIVRLYVKAINEKIKRRDKDEFEKSINFITKKLDRTSNVEYRTGLFEMLKDQEKNLMLIDSREEYALKTVDKAIAPEEKIGPKRAVICIIGTLLGFFFSMLIALYFASRKHKDI